MKYTRRQFIQGGTALALGSASSKVFGFSVVGRAQPTLRVLGTHATLLEPIRKKAEEDLGIRIEFTPGGSSEVLHKAGTRPESFDIYEQWSNSIRVLWRARAIQPIEVSRIERWNEINALSKEGRLTPSANLGLGDAPYKLLFAQSDGILGATPSERISFLPYVHNADSFAYHSAVIPEGIPYQTESWGWMLDARYRGKVAFVNAPTIGLFDLALAASAQGLMKFNDMGNMTHAELDRLFEILSEYTEVGHFRGSWDSVPDSVGWMADREVVIQSMFSPGVSTLNGMGVPCIYAAPKEGYRAWHGVMCLSANAEGDTKDAAYRFMNWWLSGWPGAFIARHGYYISNPERSRAFMPPEEWDYWYGGKPAAKPLPGTDDRISVRTGDIRRGGSYTERFSHIAVWNTVMDSYEYSLLKWRELLLS